MRIGSSVLLGMAFYLSFVSFGFAQPVYFESQRPVSKLSRSENQFAIDLYSRLATDKGNVFFSPYSLSSALEMAYEGSRSSTADEMSSVLHLDTDTAARRVEISAFIKQMNIPDKAYELSVANALWAESSYPFKDDYIALVKNTYFAEARNLDFVSNAEASRGTINAWVSDKTKNRINDLLPQGSIKPTTSLVLTDAVYFKGKWEIPFQKDFTELEDFWITPDQAVKTAMMRVTDDYDYFENNLVQVLKLPYQGQEISMLIFLPRNKNLQNLENILTLKMFKQWEESMMPQKLSLHIPKFKFDSEREMSRILIGMGMKLAFDPQAADFSGMANKISGNNLFIGAVYHKAWIETNEEGTEAAAATAVESMNETAMEEPDPKEFHADHPFIFVIEDNKTGHILFMGRVSDPR